MSNRVKRKRLQVETRAEQADQRRTKRAAAEWEEAEKAVKDAEYAENLANAIRISLLQPDDLEDAGDADLEDNKDGYETGNRTEDCYLWLTSQDHASQDAPFSATESSAMRS
ncbi:hypothetical protein BG011_005569, partial [Mortierella polycephala]